MTNQLETIESLRKNLEAVMVGPAQSVTALDWYGRLIPFLAEMSGQGPPGLRDREVRARTHADWVSELRAGNPPARAIGRREIPGRAGWVSFG